MKDKETTITAKDVYGTIMDYSKYSNLCLNDIEKFNANILNILQAVLPTSLGLDTTEVVMKSISEVKNQMESHMRALNCVTYSLCQQMYNLYNELENSCVTFSEFSDADYEKLLKICKTHSIVDTIGISQVKPKGGKEEYIQFVDKTNLDKKLDNPDLLKTVAKELNKFCNTIDTQDQSKPSQDAKSDVVNSELKNGIMISFDKSNKPFVYDSDDYVAISFRKPVKTVDVSTDSILKFNCINNDKPDIKTADCQYGFITFDENNRPCKGNYYVPKHGDCISGEISNSDIGGSFNLINFNYDNAANEAYDLIASTLANAYGIYGKDAIRFKQLFSQAYEPNNSNTEDNATNDRGVITYEIKHYDNDTFISIYRKIGDRLETLAFFNCKPESIQEILSLFTKYDDYNNFKNCPFNTCRDTVEQLEVIQTYLDAIIQILQNK